MMKRISKWLMVFILIASIYPLFVVGYTWSYVFRSDLQGGKNGPLDAYRHTLASAVVSYTAGETAVRFFTELVESKHSDSGIMDRHNNMIGAGIGSACSAFRDIEPAVKNAVRKGSVNAAEPEDITWMPETEWYKGRFF